MAPRAVGPIEKEAGASSGIGLQQDVGREAHVVIAYINEDSVFKGLLKPNDEILEVNGVKATHAKEVSEAILAAGPELTLIVCSHRRQLPRLQRRSDRSLICCFCTGANALRDDPDPQQQEALT